jgi:TolB protein
MKIAFRCSGCGDETTEINYDVYLIDVDNRELRRLTSHEGGEYSPAWSPDGRKIFFVSDREENPGIYVVNVDGTDDRQLVTTVYGDYNMMNVSYWTTFQISPDGEQIVFASDEDGTWQVFTMNEDGTQVKQLTDRLQGAGFPVWSPEGGYIVFRSLGQGFEYDIYIMDKDGGAISKLATGSDVSWSPGLR